MLYERMMEDFIMMEKVRTSDGLGGWETIWSDGIRFKAAILKNNSIQAKVAEMEGVTALYTVTVERGFPISYHDAFKRVRDGQIFRATSTPADNESPEFSNINFGQFSAEEWKLE